MLKKFLLLTFTGLLLFSPTLSNAQKSKNKTVKKSKPKQVFKIGDVDISTVVRLDEPLPANLTPEQKRRYETFDKVWNTINEHYFDPTFGGLDWLAVRAEYRKKIAALKTDFEFHQILQEMISKFKQSHFYIVLPEAFREIEMAKELSQQKELERKQNAEKDEEDESEDYTEINDDEAEIFYKYGVLIDLQVINSQVVITNVKKDSNAEKAGLKQGFILDKVNGVSFKDLIRKVESITSLKRSIKSQMSKILLSFLDGEEDTEVEITYLDLVDQGHTILIEREGIPGELATIQPNLPQQLITFESKSINDNTAYVKFNFFAYPVLNKFCEALTEFKSKDSIILDLRGNSGGAISVLWGLTGLLTNKPILLGTEVKRTGKMPHYVQPMANAFNKKLVVLIDEYSVSASEILASALQENDLATVIGEKSAGDALPALTVPLPTGGAFVYPYASFQSPKGKLLEGQGVEPTYRVSQNRNSLLNGHDLVMEKAVSFLDEERSKTKNIDKVELSPKIFVATSKNAEPPIIKALSNSNVITTVEKKQDAKALEIIRDFVEAIGGEDNLRKINSYEAEGEVEINNAGAVIFGGYSIFRKFPNKAAEIMTIEGSGEVREAFDGSDFIVQSLFTGIIKQNYVVDEYKLYADLHEMLKAEEIYPNLKYLGTFEKGERKVHLIEGITQNGTKLAFTFDTETKFLVGRAGNFLVYNFDDYQKFGDVFMPIKFTRNGEITVTLKDIKFNAEIPDSKFIKEENCFTREN